ncbi:SoxR reducing system RseC family protein [Aeromonas hydrophila]|uniref:SoxR reducing system RseC family protein n=1 Tax=Aeromonas hydrophila TaxID=644 RepID=A0A926FMG9_AERHY|nr:SoxR reducing system RseC family protein [Aeromonas hydrophila]
MSEELATVVAIDGQHAWVECERRSACSGCHQQSNCGTGTVAKAFPLQAQRLRVALTIEVSVGQQVRLGIPQASILQGAALVYDAAAVLSAGGSPAGATLAGALAVGREGVTILSCLLGGLIGFSLVRYFSNRLDQGLMVPSHAGCGPAHRHPPDTVQACISGASSTKDWPSTGLSSKNPAHIRP